MKIDLSSEDLHLIKVLLHNQVYESKVLDVRQRCRTLAQVLSMQEADHAEEGRRYYRSYGAKVHNFELKEAHPISKAQTQALLRAYRQALPTLARGATLPSAEEE